MAKCRTCSRPAEPNRAQCSLCLKRARARVSKLKNGRKQQGLCVGCGRRPPESNRVRCPICLKKRRAERKKLRQRGLCETCGNPTEANKILCVDCTKKLQSKQRERFRKLKRRVVDHKGGKCQDCGLITEHLTLYEFHHENPKDGDITISKLIGRKQPWSRIKEELDKCILLCANCHRVRHEK